MAYLLAGYDFELVDRNGASFIEVPKPNYNTLTVVSKSSHLPTWSHIPYSYVLREKFF